MYASTTPAAIPREDAVLCDEPIRKILESTRDPFIGGHGGQGAWAIYEAGLGRDKEKRALRNEGNPDENDSNRKRTHHPSAGQLVPEGGVQGSPALELNVVQQVAEQDPPGREGEGRGHVEHGPLPVLHTRLTQDPDTVAHRFDSRERSAAK